MKRLLAAAAFALLAFACTTPPGDVAPTVDASVGPPADASIEPVDAGIEPDDAGLEDDAGTVPDDAGGEPDAGVEPPPPPVTGEAGFEFLPSDATTLGEVRAVVFRLQVANASGRLPVALELTGPSGLPFQRMEREVRAEPGQPLTVEFTLPVAGTLIHNARMHGAWIATFDTQGRTLDTVRFELQP
jgi:hypothetical protein